MSQLVSIGAKIEEEGKGILLCGCWYLMWQLDGWNSSLDGFMVI